MAHKYSLEPVAVPPVDTRWRRIRTKLPVPESLPILAALREHEPISMAGQPPVIWDRAEGVNVYDAWGNMWLDWSSGVLVTNAGHGRKQICDALRAAIDKPLLATYVFPHAARAELCRALADHAPAGLDKVFLLTTGSESTENAIKLARTYGQQVGGPAKHVIVSFTGAFHGRTLGAQMIGGIPGQKDWIGPLPPGFVHVPFPDGWVNENTSFAGFETALRKAGVEPADVAGVITESYQGVGPNFLPDAYARELGAWCAANDVILVMDEVQAGFGRTGKFWAWEHYDLVPDIICCGKGISSSLPLAAVIGRDKVMHLYPPGSMTSTHSASPLPVVSAIESLKIIDAEGLVANAAALGDVLGAGLERLRAAHPDRLGRALYRGLVGGLLVVKPGTREPDAAGAQAINEACLQRGLLMFAPVGLGGGCVKIAPPLNTPQDALEEGLVVLEEACAEVL